MPNYNEVAREKIFRAVIEESVCDQMHLGIDQTPDMQTGRIEPEFMVRRRGKCVALEAPYFTILLSDDGTYTVE